MEEDTFHQFGRFYRTSDARSEPLPAFTSTRQIVSSSQPPSPPLWIATSSPVKIKKGLWRDGSDFLHSSDWPPVQQYLSETSRNRRLAPAPTETVFALAALEVLHQPHNPVHWLFWGAAYLSSTSKTVNKIARTFSDSASLHSLLICPPKVHRPRLIKTDVPWIGISEYKRVISAIQEKWEYVHIRKRWYPVDGQTETSTKRLLRSSGDRGDQSIYSYFNLPEDGEPPLKRTRRAGRKALETQDPCSADRAKVESRPSPPSTSGAASEVVSIKAAITEVGPATRASSRKRRKPTSSTLLSSPTPSSVEEVPVLPVASSILLSPTSLMIPGPCDISSATSSHSRNRSISQSSMETLVDSDPVQMRSESVASTDTAVEDSLSKKRKLEVAEECLELVASEMAELEGMVTRGRASKFRLVETNSEKSASGTSRSNTPAKEGKTIAENPKTRARKSRVKK